MGITQFPNGITSMGSPLTSGSYLTTGSIFYVDSVTGSNDYTGTEPTRAVATIDKAVTLCTSGKCDTIFVMPNHAETISSSTGCRITKSGVKIVGLGRGENRPTLTFDTAITADISITGAGHSAWLENLLLIGGIDDLTHPIYTDGSEVHIVNCEWRDAPSIEAEYVIYMSSTAHRITIDGFIMQQDTDPTGAADDREAVIHLRCPTRCEIKNCFIISKATQAIILGDSGGGTDGERASWIHDNFFENVADETIIQWSSLARHAIISDNMMKVSANASEAIAVGFTTATFLFNNWVCDNDGEFGTVTGAATVTS